MSKKCDGEIECPIVDGNCRRHRCRFYLYHGTMDAPAGSLDLYECAIILAAKKPLTVSTEGSE